MTLDRKFPAFAIAGLCLTALTAPLQAAQCVTGVASWNRLNVRSGPSACYPVMFSLRHNQGNVSNPYRCRGNWCKISFRGSHGWANARFLYRDEGGDGDPSTPPAAFAPAKAIAVWSTTASPPPIAPLP